MKSLVLVLVLLSSIFFYFQTKTKENDEKNKSQAELLEEIPYGVSTKQVLRMLDGEIIVVDSELTTILNIRAIFPLEYHYQSVKKIVFLKYEAGVYSWDTKDIVINLPKIKTPDWTWFFILVALLLGLCVFFFIYYAYKKYNGEEVEPDNFVFCFLGFFALWILEFFVSLLFSPFLFFSVMGIMIAFNFPIIALFFLIGFFYFAIKFAIKKT